MTAFMGLTRIAYGWACVATQGGRPVIDTTGETIAAADLARAATEFMKSPVPVARVMHNRRRPVGVVVHSFPLTADLAKALGIRCDREGWIVGVKVDDDEVAEAIESGELPGLSIGGVCRRVPT